MEDPSDLRRADPSPMWWNVVPTRVWSVSGKPFDLWRYLACRLRRVSLWFGRAHGSEPALVAGPDPCGRAGVSYSLSADPRGDGIRDGRR